MEVQIQLEQMIKDSSCDTANCFLGDTCEDGVTKFSKDGSTDPRGAI